jgi:hypothetical protein
MDSLEHPASAFDSPAVTPGLPHRQCGRPRTIRQVSLHTNHDRDGVLITCDPDQWQPSRVEASAADKVAFCLDSPVAPGRVCAAGLLLLVPGAGFSRGHLVGLGQLSVVALDRGVPPEAQAGLLVLRLHSTQCDALACEHGNRHGVHGVIHQGWLTWARSAIGKRHSQDFVVGVQLGPFDVSVSDGLAVRSPSPLALMSSTTAPVSR